MKNIWSIVLLCACVSMASAQNAQPDSLRHAEPRFRVGGYGEILARFMNYGINRFSGATYGNEHVTRNDISIPRFVIAIDYNFNDRWSLGSEIEFEAGGTGSAIELENSENGEYETETEKGGEVAIEQFHLTYKAVRAFNVRVGHIIVPVGLTNAHHEPINFFGAARPEGETTIIPSTWHETGLEFFGSVGPVDYQLMVVGGLNANGFERGTWVASGKQGLFETDNFTSPAYVARLDWHVIKGLRVGGSYYFVNDAGKNSDKPSTYSSIGKARVSIATADFQYKNRFVTARGNMIYGHLQNSAGVSKVNRTLSNKSPYSRLVPVAKKAVSYAGEVGLNVKGIFAGGEKFPSIFPFARYEYYNPQEDGESSQTMDARYKVSMWELGANWYALPNLVVKADYVTRSIGGGDYNSENEVRLGVAFVGWFFSK